MNEVLKNKENQTVKKRYYHRKSTLKHGRPIGLYKGRFLLDDKKENIIQLLNKNMTVKNIAQQLQVNVNTVHTYLKKHSFLIPEKYRRINTHSKLYNKEAYILQKLKEGVSKAAIARELGVSREALFNKLHQMGWQETNPYRKKKIDLTLFLKAFNEGKTYQEMAGLFHCHKQTVINKAKELRLKRYEKIGKDNQKRGIRYVEQKERCIR